ncbi:hypothetical protein [Clostridium saccharoperbutylacetonicum]
MNEKIENIIFKCLRCELTGDAAMSQISNVLNEERENRRRGE